MGTWTFHVEDRTGSRVGQVSDYTKATLVVRFNGVGSWVIEGMPMASQAAQLLVPGSRIVAVRDGTTELSGHMLQPTTTWNEDGYTLTASGVDDNLYLAGRLGFPAAPSTDLNAAYSDDRAGPAETVMYGYVDNNLGPSADAARQPTPGLALGTDLARGATVAKSVRLTQLLPVLQELGVAAGGVGLGFRVVAVDPDDYSGNHLLFEVYAPTVRPAAIFSPQLGNLASRVYDTKMGDLTWVVVAGGGEGVLRTFVTDQNAASEATWGLRLEAFVDQRQTTDLTELAAAGADALASGADQQSLTLVPVDTDAVAYGTSYGLGDVVSVVAADGVTVTDVVREVKFEVQGDGEVVTPLVGTPGAVVGGTSAADALGLIFARQAATAQRLGLLERAL